MSDTSNRLVCPKGCDYTSVHITLPLPSCGGCGAMLQERPPAREYFAVLAPWSPRAPVWERVYGGRRVPIESDVPIRGASVATPGQVQLFYKVAVRRLSVEQFESAIAHVMQTGLSRAEVEADILGAHGIPLLADDIAVEVVEG